MLRTLRYLRYDGDPGRLRRAILFARMMEIINARVTFRQANLPTTGVSNGLGQAREVVTCARQRAQAQRAHAHLTEVKRK
jgi:hypothetical protein